MRYSSNGQDFCLPSRECEFDSHISLQYDPVVGAIVSADRIGKLSIRAVLLRLWVDGQTTFREGNYLEERPKAKALFQFSFALISSVSQEQPPHFSCDICEAVTQKVE